MSSSGADLLTQMRKGVVDYCVLSQLQGEPAYGLELSRRLSKYPHVVGKDDTLYPVLARLKKRGHVETRWEESAEGPPRKYYELTDAGREDLARFRRVWSQFRGGVDDLLTEEPDA